MKARKYLLLWAASILLIVFIVMCICIGYFPIAGKMIAEMKIREYTQEDINVKYQILDNVYKGTNSSGQVIQYDLKKNTIYNEAYNRTISGQVNEKYQSYIMDFSSNTIEYPKSISVWSEVDANEPSKDYIKIYIMTIFEDVSLDDEQSKNRMCKMAKQLIEYLDINCTSFQLVYANYTGIYEVSYDAGKSTINFDKVRSAIQKFEEKNWPLDYIEWKNE